MKNTLLSVALATASLGLAGAPAAQAARSYDNCTGFIESLPAVIDTQGTWCMNKDLGTSLASGSAITITANNVILDCNDFKLGGLAAGTGTHAKGISAYGHVNLTARNCNVRGFMMGLHFYGPPSAGHVVQDSRFDGNTYIGLSVTGDGSLVRGNRILDTGGATVPTGTPRGIDVSYGVDVLDNVVSGVSQPADELGNASAMGILSSQNDGGQFRGNVVRGLVAIGQGYVTGLYLGEHGDVGVVDNQFTGGGWHLGTGVSCQNPGGHISGNLLMGFASPVEGPCTDADAAPLPPG